MVTLVYDSNHDCSAILNDTDTEQTNFKYTELHLFDKFSSEIQPVANTSNTDSSVQEIINQETLLQLRMPLVKRPGINQDSKV